jgi:hypothetical protein
MPILYSMVSLLKLDAHPPPQVPKPAGRSYLPDLIPNLDYTRL